MKNHAFLILAHKQPQLLARILRVLEKENHYFFVHIDRKYPDLDDFISACVDISNTCFLTNNVKVFHAGISIVDAEILMLRETEKCDVAFDYYHLISGQDYPLRSNEIFDDFFEHTDHSFMCIDSADLQRQLAGYYDTCANGFHFNNTLTLWSRIYEKLRLSRLSPLWYRRPKIDHYLGGWQWFSWNKKTKDFVMQYIKDHPEYLRRFNHTASPDEHVFTTLLNLHKDELDIETANPLRYISWHPHRAVDTDYRPYDLTEEDLPWVVGSKAFFCRKVDEAKSAKLLYLIDQQRNSEYDIQTHNDFV